MRLSWENEEAKSRHVDFQCVRSKSITNLDNVDGLDAQVVEEQVEFGAVGGIPLAVELYAFGGGQVAAPYPPYPANFENNLNVGPQPSPPLAVSSGVVLGQQVLAADQPLPTMALGLPSSMAAPTLTQALAQQARMSSGHQHDASSSDDD